MRASRAMPSCPPGGHWLMAASPEAMAAEAVRKYIESRPVRKAIVVPGRLINLVV